MRTLLLLLRNCNLKNRLFSICPLLHLLLDYMEIVELIVLL